jgi:Spy/CpxP family protein refolding chaperone
MKRMKLIGVVALAIGLLVAVAAIANAQMMQHGRMGFRGRCGAFMRGIHRLNLTDTQKQQARQIAEQAKKDALAVLTPQQQQQVQQFMQKRSQRLQLTQEQRDKIKALHQDARAQIEKVKANTQLTPDQKRDQIRAICQSTRQQMQQIIPQAQRPHMGRGQHPAQALNLTDAQKTQLKAVRDQALAKFRAILTPEQQAQFDQMRQQHGQVRHGQQPQQQQ